MTEQILRKNSKVYESKTQGKRFQFVTLYDDEKNDDASISHRIFPCNLPLLTSFTKQKNKSDSATTTNSYYQLKNRR